MKNRSNVLPKADSPVDAAPINVRPAVREDKDYVIEAFQSSLKQHYGGDHRAHALRVLETHLSGKDPRGLLSLRQLLLILWEGEARKGILNLVFKRQGTCKISPLLLHPTGEDSRGFGTILLHAAEEQAREVGARQIYCTVAERNSEALTFFRQHGFVACGSASGQYKENEVEILLRRPLQPQQNTHTNSESIISTSLVEDNQWPNVRPLLEKGTKLCIEGADADWLNALRQGTVAQRELHESERRPTWTYAARDRTGEYRAAAIVTAKKGDALKVMPIASTDTMGFECLLIDLPTLLSGKGRKIYLHHHPSPQETAVLQENDWELEAEIPGAYHANLVTQQWGFQLEPGRKMKTLRIQQRYLSMISSGRKTLEIRVGYDHIRKIQPGDHIRFAAGANRVVCRVSTVRQYSSFKEMLECEPVEKALPGFTAEHALSQLQEIYPHEKERLGILVFELSDCNSS